MKNSTQAPDKRKRRYRPLGLTIAIISTALMYGFYPLAPLLLVFWLQIQGHSGIGVDLIPDTGGRILIGLGVLNLIASVAAWKGRPSGVRLILIVLVWLTTGLQIARSFISATSFQPTGGTFSPTLPALLCQVPLLLIVPLYVTWYLNRAPARQFYRPTTQIMAEQRLDSQARS